MSTATATLLPTKTIVSDLKPGDVFAYQARPKTFRSSPIASIENIGGQSVATDPTCTYAEGMYRIRHEDSDEIGTLYYGNETVWRADRR